jgi:hypothetical protein
MPLATLKDIERGQLELTPEVLARIAIATGVDKHSLLAGDHPILDFQGQPLSRSSSNMVEFLLITADPSFLEARKQLFEAALEAAQEKKVSALMAFSFETWLLATIETFGLETFLEEKLTKRLHLFDPIQIRPEFRPKNEQMAAEWKQCEEQIAKEDLRLSKEKFYTDMPENLLTASARREEARTGLLEARRKKEEAAGKVPDLRRQRKLMDLKARIMKNLLKAEALLRRSEDA